jgi:hypothetical protein
MSRFSTTYFRIWAAIIVTHAFCMVANADVVESRPTLVFRIINDGQIPEETVETAKKHVEHIYGHSGIQVEWIEGDGARCPKVNGKLDLTMIFVPESVAVGMNRPIDATGFAVSNDGEGLRRAYIFVERVGRQAAVVQHKSLLEEKAAKGLILGEVIAHEAGHLMLPHDSHSARGIMQARLDLKTIEQGLRGGLLFTADQAKQIRGVLVSRTEAN